MTDGYGSKAGSADEELEDALLDALFSRSPAGLHIYDRHLRLVRVNTAARMMRDFPVDRMVGCSLSEILRAFDISDRGSVERTARRVLESGRPVFDLAVRLRSRREPTVEVVTSATVLRLQGTDGTVLGVAAALTDVTARVRAEADLRLLNEAATRVGTTLDVFRTAAEFGDLAVPRLADTVTVDVYDTVVRGHAPTPESRDQGAVLRRAGFRSAAGTEYQGVPRVGEVTTYPPATPYRAALDTLAPRLIGRLGPDTSWLDPDRRRDARILAAGVHSMLLVPIRARGLVLGLACFYRWRNPTPFDDKDLVLAEQLITHAALCLDNARQYGRERSTARILTGRLAHPETPGAAAVDLAHTYLPAGTGGAWFDVIPLSGARIALVAGDAAAEADDADPVAMGELRAAIEALSDLDLPPDEILERLHDLTSRPQPFPSGSPGLPSPDTSPASCLYVVYDPVTRLCTAASAGHPAPFLVHPGGDVETLDVAPGPPLGQDIAQYRSTERALPTGSTLLLYNTALLAEPVMAQSLPSRIAEAAPGLSLQSLCDSLALDLGPDRLGHDAFLLLARTRALGPEQTNTWTFPNDPAIVSMARKAATDQLTRWGVDADLVDNTALIVSELVTNAVRYAKGTIRLRLILGDTLTCEVADDSSTAPHLRRALDTDEHGRGLFITAQLTRRWGVRGDRRGKAIWAEQDLVPSSPPSMPERHAPVGAGTP
ncbi:SpoIIE family protein phosphatase [Streptomyces populi]|uniref:SpoIIE family protein phosphatase n=1 Tax=Streptomyces populi TaxID=2058924 RepID=UPI0013A6DB4C|nr:SpoIIE family protein phosphatase [Streptomyces populi]